VIQVALVILFVTGAALYIFIEKMPQHLNIKIANYLRKSKNSFISKIGLKMMRRGCKNCK